MSTPGPLDLLVEARLIADYARLTGCLRHPELFDALDAAESSQWSPAPSGGPDPTRLRLIKALHDTASVVPYHTRSRLIRAYTKGPDEWPALAVKRMEDREASRLVVLSIVVMIVLTFLVGIYWTGIAAQRDFEALVAADARDAYLRGLWEHGGIVPTDDQIEVAAFLEREGDLLALNQLIGDAQANGLRYLNELSPFPLPGMRFTYCHGNRLVRSLGLDTRNLNLRYSQVCQGYTRNEGFDYLANQIHGSLSCNRQEDVPAGTLVTDPAASSPIQQMNRIEAAVQSLICQNVPVVYPSAIQDFSQLARVIERRQTLYGMILPSLFGAFGAIFYHLRRLTNPLLPNASGRQLLHRMVMGALGGTLLSWVSLAPSPLGGFFPEPGLGIFLFAFVMGFSLNVLFSLLERLVDATEAAISPSTDRPRAVPPPTG